MRKMRSKTVEQLERFWNALVAAAHGPLRKADYPFGIAAKCAIDKQTARSTLKHLHNAGYLMPVHRNDERGKPLVAAQLLKTEFSVSDFPVSKNAARKSKLITPPAPMPAPVATTITFRQRIAIFLDLDNLCINLQKLGMILGISDIIQNAAKEGTVIACFGFIQRNTLERNREAINGFPPELNMVVAPDYSQASDQKMLQMIRRFADNNIADAFFIGTADTQLFEAAQSAAKRVGKRAVLLDCCQLSFGIRSEADRIFRIQNAAVPFQKQQFLECAKRIAKMKHLGRNREAIFLRDIVHQLRLILEGERSLEFRELQGSVWHWLRRNHETINWSLQDCAYALGALHDPLKILVTHQDREKTYYRLNREAETYRVF